MRFPVLLAAGLLLVSGCGSDDSDMTTLNPNVTPDTTLVVDIAPAMK